MKLHLGCGRRHIPGFVHIDVVDHPHIDHQCSVDSLSFLADDSVELIYNCHPGALSDAMCSAPATKSGSPQRSGRFHFIPNDAATIASNIAEASSATPIEGAWSTNQPGQGKRSASASSDAPECRMAQNAPVRLRLAPRERDLAAQRVHIPMTAAWAATRLREGLASLGETLESGDLDASLRRLFGPGDAGQSEQRQRAQPGCTQTGEAGAG